MHRAAHNRQVQLPVVDAGLPQATHPRDHGGTESAGSGGRIGALTAFFQWGWGARVICLGAASPIEGYLPELVLAVLFGNQRVRVGYGCRGNDKEFGVAR
ncbi:hypothetical protein [Nocardia sp. NBC_00511]|uniref:hypothetical protein n=1 Tax=Nocardia sp. NBC_00511 TaxID=2903591 RepID=UPI0030DF77A3